MTPIALSPGTLWARLQSRTVDALRSGALQPIPTRHEVVQDAGIPFIVRVVSNVARKAAARVLPAAGSDSTPQAAAFDPFLPYDPAMFVADVSDTHVALLNKFNVVEHHLLLVTRAFEEQESMLTRADFEALCACLGEIDGLGFYNSGAAAGASQRHKHLQLMTLPLAPEGPRVPLEALLPAPTELGTRPVALPGLPFRHAVSGRQIGDRSIADAGAAAYDAYRRLLEAAGLPGAADAKSALPPYNLLVTRRWMLLVPRTREDFESISVNALGFAGALLVRDQAALARLRTVGPMQVLASVAGTSSRLG